MNLWLSDSRSFEAEALRQCNRRERRDMDQEIRNKLRNVVTQCRKLLEDDIRDDA